MTTSKARAAMLLGAGAIAGGILAGTLTANAATGSSTTTSPAAGSSSSSSAPADRFSPTPVRSDEKAVDPTLAATLKQKAEDKTGGTVYRVETDADGATYEAHVRKSDGTLVTVKFDSSGNITGVEDGMGAGDPQGDHGGHGGPGGAPQGGNGGSSGQSGSSGSSSPGA